MHAAPSHPEWMEGLCGRLAEDDEGRVCEAISGAECRESGPMLPRMRIGAVLPVSGLVSAAARAAAPSRPR